MVVYTQQKTEELRTFQQRIIPLSTFSVPVYVTSIIITYQNRPRFHTRLKKFRLRKEPMNSRNQSFTLLLF